jgi:uncharacterized protein (DUF433 family)
MDWTDCSLVETRIRAQTIIDNFEAGTPVEEIAENWPELPESTIDGIIAYYDSHQPQHR